MGLLLFLEVSGHALFKVKGLNHPEAQPSPLSRIPCHQGHIWGVSSTVPQITGSHKRWTLTATTRGRLSSLQFVRTGKQRKDVKRKASAPFLKTTITQMETDGGKSFPNHCILVQLFPTPSWHYQKVLLLEEDLYIRIPGMLSIGICRTPSLKQESPG